MWAWKWAWRSWALASSLSLEKARRLAASLALGEKWPSLLKRQELYAFMMVTERRWHIWWRRRPRSEAEMWRPSILVIWSAFAVASFERRLWKSCETSPYWPATRQRRSPKLLRCCSRGLTWLGSVPRYFTSMLWALTRYSLGRFLARWSTVFWLDLYQVAPALRDLISTSWLLAGPCSSGKVMWSSGTRPQGRPKIILPGWASRYYPWRNMIFGPFPEEIWFLDHFLKKYDERRFSNWYDTWKLDHWFKS